MQAHNLLKSTIETQEQSVNYLKINNKDTWAMSPDEETLNSNHWHCSGVFIVNFEHILDLSLFLLLTLNIREYISIICNYNIWVFYNIGNSIVIRNYNISVSTVKVIFMFIFFKILPTNQPNHKQDLIYAIPSFQDSVSYNPVLFPLFKQKFFAPPPNTTMFGKSDFPRNLIFLLFMWSRERGQAMQNMWKFLIIFY